MNRRDFLSIGLGAATIAFPYSVIANQGKDSLNGYDIDLTGQKDSTDEFQRLLNDAAVSAQPVPNGMQKALVIIHGIIRVSKTLIIDASRVNILGPATIYFSKQALGINYGIVLNSNSLKNVSFTNGVGSLFDSVNFFSEIKINLFFASNLKTSDTNPSCLINISQCRFTGFDKIFTNGAGGWGWNWDRCGFDECSWLLYITQQMDSYERFSFTSCIWQNGGTAFYVDNPFGKIYWTAGSFDYCDAIAYIKRGYVSVSGHLEFKKREKPAVTLLSDDCHFYFLGGSIYAINCSEPFTLFKQYSNDQITIRDVNFMYDKVNDGVVTLSNMNLETNSILFKKRQR